MEIAPRLLVTGMEIELVGGEFGKEKVHKMAVIFT